MADDGKASGPRWSLIVPSHNGEDTLPLSLGSLAGLTPPAGGMEIILVDNASTDGTALLMQEFATRTGARFLSEPRRGKSHALNTAMDRARGEMLVFLDDDVIADSRLAEAFAAAADEFPDTAVFAGQIRPSWQAPPPAWLAALADEGQCCGCTPSRLAAGWVSTAHVKGGNMALRRSLIGASRFVVEGVNFGTGARPTGGEDTEFVRRVAGNGPVLHVPKASVKHIVAPDEMTWRGVFTRYLRIGRGHAAQDLSGRGIPSVAARAAIRALFAASAFAIGRKTAAARQGTRLAMLVGALDYRINLRSDA